MSLQPRARAMALRALLHPQPNPQDRDLERSQRFSWLRCALSILSYLLMLSDVPRAGFGLHDLSYQSRIEPEQFIFFGPYAYPVTAQLLRKATGTTDSDSGTLPSSSPFWPYKYDTTSVVMRAVARHLAILEWRSVCMTYDETCDERAGIPHSVLFGMIDSLIDAVKTHKDVQRSNGQAGRLTLRTEYNWSDRLHDYAFPWFFSSPKLRTIQATHYDVELLSAKRPDSLCSAATRRRRPLSCGDSWTNFDRLCAPTNPFCQDVGSVHSHVPARLQKLLETYPLDHTMDFVLLEGVDDLTRSSLTSDGYKNIDVVVLARIRKCSSSGNSSSITSQCETILVDDFRYEVAPLVTNVREWFWIIAILRGTGQFYAWIRLLLLLVGCYAARADEPSVKQCSYFGRFQLSVRTMFLLPSQVVVYGSLFPISCYLLAHLIDSAPVYELMTVQFSTILGVVSLDFWLLVRVCAVSMRSLWLLTFACHVLHRVAVHRAWSPTNGVPGVPEFSLSVVASLTILAQVRYPSLRDSRILSVEDLVPSGTRYQLNSLHSDSRPSLLYKLLFGTIIDYKCLAVALCFQFSVVVLLRLVNRLVPRCFPYQSVLISRTIVPFCAGSLWPASAMVVSWSDTFLVKQPWSPVDTPSQPRVQFQSFYNALGVGIKPFRRLAIRPIQQHRVVAAAISGPPTATVHHEHDWETRIFLMNLVVMTDPLTVLRLRVLPGHAIGVYTTLESRPHTKRDSPTPTLLLPLALSTTSLDIPIDWSKLELRLAVHTSELAWRDLLKCG